VAGSFLLVALLWDPAGAETVLSGPLSGVLGAAGNPYRVVADISVAAGDTLRLEAGCELVFEPGTGLDVSGRLEVAGQAGSRVRFGPVIPGAAAGSWTGVNAFSLSESDWEHFVIEGAETGLHVLNGAAAVRDGTIDRSGKYGLRLDVTATAERIDVTRAGQESASYAGIFVGGGAPSLSACTVSDCAGTGVGAWTPAAPLFTDCVIENCRSGVTSVGADTWLERCTVRGHGIPGDFDSGAGLFVGFATGTTVAVECVIEHNFFGVAVINDGLVNLGNLVNASIDDDGYNVFRANDTFDGTIRHVWNETGNVQTAHNNAWIGSGGPPETDPLVIDSWIYDDDEAVGAAVEFLPLGGPPTSVALPEAGAAGWRIFPNPARGAVRLTAPAGRAAAPFPAFEVVDVTGRRRAVVSPDPSGRAELRLPAGVYWLRPRGESTSPVRVVLQR